VNEFLSFKWLVTGRAFTFRKALMWHFSVEEAEKIEKSKISDA
jgi:hypothetical protein